MNIAFLWEWPINEFTGGVGTVTKVLAKELLRREHKVVFISFMSDAEKQRNAHLLKQIGYDQDTYPYIAPQYFVTADQSANQAANAINDILDRNEIQVVLVQDMLKVIVLPNIINRCVTIINQHRQPFEAYDYVREVYKDYVPNTWMQKVWKYAVRAFPCIGKWRIKKYNIPKYRYSVRHADRLCLLSQRFVPRLLRFMPDLRKEHLCAINNPNTFKCVPTQLSGKENLVIIVARLFESTKNVTHFLEAWQIVENHTSNWKAKVVGTGRDFEMLKQRAVRLGLKTLSFVGYQSDVSHYYKKAKMVCVTSWFEGWGMTITEGMANGCVPLVYNTYEAVSDIFDDGISGMLIKSCTPQELANRVLSLVENPLQLQEIANNATKKVQQFSPEKIVDEWESLFKQVMIEKGILPVS